MIDAEFKHCTGCGLQLTRNNCKPSYWLADCFVCSKSCDIIIYNNIQQKYKHSVEAWDNPEESEEIKLRKKRGQLRQDEYERQFNKRNGKLIDRYGQLFFPPEEPKLKDSHND